jgi:anion-transporting  ArsA/GET3 family ATPase
VMRFFEGRTIRVLLSQGGFAGRVAGRAGSPLLSVLGRLAGADVLREVTAFISAIGSMADGLAARAAAVSSLLRDPATSFVLVSSPRRESVQEAIAFAAELARAQLELTALVVNRVHGGASAGDLTGLEALVGARLASAVRASVAELAALAAADRAALERLDAAFPALEPVVVPELTSPVEDLAGLRQLAKHLGYRSSSITEASPSAAQ